MQDEDIEQVNLDFKDVSPIPVPNIRDISPIGRPQGILSPIYAEEIKEDEQQEEAFEVRQKKEELELKYVEEIRFLKDEVSSLKDELCQCENLKQENFEYMRKNNEFAITIADQKKIIDELKKIVTFFIYTKSLLTIHS